MSFNEGANLDTSQVTGGGSRGGLAIGGGIGGLVIVLVAAFLGIDPAVLGAGGGTDPFSTNQVQGGGDDAGETFDQCKTGADANRDDTCRIIGTVNSVQAYWEDALPADVSRQYRAAKTVIYSGATQSPCGTASNQTGPFYCPSDERIYIDASFFDELTSRFGADGGALAQEYVVAHEYGHHVENILGFLAKGQDGTTGPQSGGVRIELMADCMAGVWANHASTTTDADGNTLLEPLTDQDIQSALSAAAAVGDDHIQESLGGGNVNQDSWTHGSSESRQKWFLAGYESGTVNACDTFSTNDL
ncbi:KPN_02809 family neutral zinc metallopeptidase [Aeromicrobium stalagmiti]|uniref:KPN_02809 family neutral zinc metallopeptidase n=1 Tax=Aeromicrobium stalagmiti TaxID=2738988 RepID=UPI001567D091|nr:neutral zinc metallopeptidase [Aeromicrobium stalagmiti]NRQ50769.1 neutral zinc metallopeptidase [Aeromicrobium stalagmiti]